MLLIRKLMLAILFIYGRFYGYLLENNIKMRGAYLLAFLTGPTHPGIIPHVSSKSPFGFLNMNKVTSNQMIHTSKLSANGIASFWLAGFIQGLYITSNASRNLLVREEIMGITSDAIRQINHTVLRNHVMTNFLVWQNINSEMYQKQRRFLDVNFQKNVKASLPTVRDCIEEYVIKYSGEHQLKKFVFGLTLYIGSRLPVISMSDYPLDALFHSDEQFEKAMYRVAVYGTARIGDDDFEAYLHQVFLKLVENNFECIRVAEVNLLKNIFESRDLPFPATFDEFKSIAPDMIHSIGMNFFSVALGAMVHTTANSLDWALAYLSHNQDEMEYLKTLVRKNPDLDLTDRRVFENELRSLRDFVLSNVFKNPTFSHEHFIVNKTFSTTLHDGSQVRIPQDTLIVVNYLECNRSQAYYSSRDEMSSLLARHTTEGFSMDCQVASFGGSIKNEENRQSRKCPGRNFSMYEQMIILAVLLNHYDINFNKVDCSTEDTDFPVHTRTNKGSISLTRSAIKCENPVTRKLTYAYDKKEEPDRAEKVPEPSNSCRSSAPW